MNNYTHPLAIRTSDLYLHRDRALLHEPSLCSKFPLTTHSHYHPFHQFFSQQVVCLNQSTGTFSPPRMIRPSNFSKLEGIAYDWITDNLYWLKAAVRQLGVTKDGRLTKVLYQGAGIFDKPRDVAVHPGLG